MDGRSIKLDKGSRFLTTYNYTKSQNFQCSHKILQVRPQIIFFDFINVIKNTITNHRMNCCF